MNRYSLAGLDKFKTYIDESGSTYDVLFQDLISRASALCERITKRKLRGRSYTEYQNGDGVSDFVHTIQYPIIGTTADVDLYDDIDRNFTSSYKFADDDWVLDNDEGLIELLSDASIGSVFQKGVKNIKIVYTAGYDEYEIITGYNDAIDFNEGGSELNATLDEDTYTASELCTEIDTQLEAAGAGSYTVTFNEITCKFTIVKASGTFQLLWNSGTNSATSAGDLLGFVTSADDTGALTYTADYSRPGVPEDLQEACMLIAFDMWLKSKASPADKFGEKSIQHKEAGTLSYIQTDIPVEAMRRLQTYVRFNI